MIDKELVAKRFSKSIKSYDANADAQRTIAERMLAMISRHLKTENPKISEFGCGTGVYSKMLLKKLNPSSLWLNDICNDLKDYYAALDEPRIYFHAGDAESIEFPMMQDVITGCSSIQWFNSQESFLDRIENYLSEDGILAFSTFLPGNLHEIEGIMGKGLKYHSEEEYASMLKDKYDILEFKSEDLELEFNSGLEVLKHLKATGVTGVRVKSWTPRVLNAFCEEYGRRYSKSDKVVLTYRPLYIIAKPIKNK